MGCAVCNKFHFREGRIREAFSRHQATIEDSISRVDLTRINTTLPLRLPRLVRDPDGATKVFFLDCRYLKVFTGTCPLPGSSFKMGTANFEPTVGILNSSNSYDFFSCSDDLKPTMPIAPLAQKPWMSSRSHFVELDAFLRVFSYLERERFDGRCLAAAQDIWKINIS